MTHENRMERMNSYMALNPFTTIGEFNKMNESMCDCDNKNSSPIINSSITITNSPIETEDAVTTSLKGLKVMTYEKMNQIVTSMKPETAKEDCETLTSMAFVMKMLSEIKE